MTQNIMDFLMPKASAATCSRTFLSARHPAFHKGNYQTPNCFSCTSLSETRFSFHSPGQQPQPWLSVLACWRDLMLEIASLVAWPSAGASGFCITQTFPSNTIQRTQLFSLVHPLREISALVWSLCVLIIMHIHTELAISVRWIKF